MQRQPNANTVQVVDAVRALMPRFRDELPQSVEINMVNDRSISIREAVHDVQLTLLGTVAAGGAGDLPVPAPRWWPR